MTPTSTDPIQHVVLLMLSRRSFDQMLGAFKESYINMQGVDAQNLRTNYDPFRNPIHQAPTTERRMRHAPLQELEDVAIQLSKMNTGFVLDFSDKRPDAGAADRQLIMSYYPLGFLPALHALARDFTICDRWFSSVPGPSWPNRSFALSGTSLGQVRMPEAVDDPDIGAFFNQRQETLFDRLSERGRTWGVFFHDIPQSWALEHQRRPENASHYRRFSEFAAAAAGPEEAFPNFVYVEPRYLGPEANDGHPFVDVMRSEQLIAEVYNAIRGNAALWKKVLFVITYDSHGGFFDHDVPPNTVPPDRHVRDFGFDTYGVRVPALLVSPWAKRGALSTLFDHTSLLKYLIEKWGLGHLRRRTEAAHSIGEAILTTGAPREDTPSRIVLSPEQALFQPGEADVVPTHHWALAVLAKRIEAELEEKLPEELPSAAALPEYIRTRVDRFLEQQKKREAGTSALTGSFRRIGSLLHLR